MKKEGPTPWERFRRDMNSFFGKGNIDIDYGLEGPYSRSPRWRSDMEYPSADIIETDSEFIISLDMPGLDKESIKINLTENDFEVKSEKESQDLKEDEFYVRAERTYRGFYRKFALPEPIITEDAKASYKSGVLQVRLPKSRKSKRRPLEIE
jgi:HSP20 family molecular chaperone IbpA